jgi:hypothetical protein
LTTAAGRSTTSPAAMRSTRVGGSWRMVMAAVYQPNREIVAV